MTCLENSADFKQYLKSLTVGEGCTGTFQMARLYQRRCAMLEGEDGITSAPKIEVTPRHFTRSQTKRTQGSPSQRPSVKSLTDDMDNMTLGGGGNVPHTPKTPWHNSGGAGGDDDGDNGDDSDSDDGVDHCIYLSPFASYDSPLASQYTDNVFQVIEDEQIVNFALCLLLDSLVEQSGDVVEGGHWTPTRSPFKVKDGKSDKLADMIVEVKLNSREKGGPEVDMQESAQMTAWVATLARETEAAAQKEAGPEPTAAKNRNRIFVTIATFDDAYVDYISSIGTSYEGTEGPLLEMQRYGAAEVSENGDMKRLCAVLLALAIEGGVLNE
ncbi:hypothetical protein ISF_05481 [Cordyceps fumosorosea ARSEF 2679]|uniref:Uncharacterized protein n=1 Tax=Cordyceps fumosorosea (strain ARSEF 2679) TaxID=1081104 RepID=A0A167UB21_CORFA|nr:hypothetical protein ISF_05481 [Cordyceps fumosorosea ARSEF 2679]OAA61402.1 hypothetical protein ISF_05481 [Cordyceps fumosorosea ARSEF 2679]